MDTIPKLKFLVFLLLFIPSLALSQSAPTGYVDLAGWVKGVDGTYSKAFEGANRTTPLAGSLKVIGDASVSTSKGFFSIPVEKTAVVATSRLGSAVASIAKKAGPLGMSVAAVSLVCELTSVCNDAGAWALKQLNFGDSATSGYYGTCQEAIGLAAGANWTDCTTKNAAYPGAMWFRTPKTPPASAGCTNRGGTSWTYFANAYTCTNPPVIYTPASDSAIDSKAPLLNDDRFVPELIDKQADIPTGLPTITNAPKAIISQDTSVTKDANGNVTGTKVTSTEAEIVDAATAESPGKAIVKETTTVTNYDINNTVINSTTSTSYSSQPPPPDKPVDSITISFDDVPDDAIEHEDVDTELETPESWGDGFCPADETIDYHYGTLTFDFQPTCDFAIGVRPVLIFMASVTALFIVAGVKLE